jgi:protein ImuB
MGQDGKRLRQLARGALPHLFQPVEQDFVLEERMDLDTPVELLDSLMFVVGVMLDQLILRAKARILALASVTITLSLEGGASHSRTVQPALPTTDKQLWIKLLHLDLEAHPPQASILAVALHAEPGSTSKVQSGLFSPQLPEAARLDVTLARISVHDSRRRRGYRISTSPNQLVCPCSASLARAIKTSASSSRNSRCVKSPRERAQPHSKMYSNTHPGWFALRAGTKDLWQLRCRTAAKLLAKKL